MKLILSIIFVCFVIAETLGKPGYTQHYSISKSHNETDKKIAMAEKLESTTSTSNNDSNIPTNTADERQVPQPIFEAMYHKYSIENYNQTQHDEMKLEDIDLPKLKDYEVMPESNLYAEEVNKWTPKSPVNPHELGNDIFFSSSKRSMFSPGYERAVYIYDKMFEISHDKIIIVGKRIYPMTHENNSHLRQVYNVSDSQDLIKASPDTQTIIVEKFAARPAEQIIKFGTYNDEIPTHNKILPLKYNELFNYDTHYQDEIHTELYDKIFLSERSTTSTPESLEDFEESKSL